MAFLGLFPAGEAGKWHFLRSAGRNTGKNAQKRQFSRSNLKNEAFSPCQTQKCPAMGTNAYGMGCPDSGMAAHCRRTSPIPRT